MKDKNEKEILSLLKLIKPSQQNGKFKEEFGVKWPFKMAA